MKKFITALSLMTALTLPLAPKSQAVIVLASAGAAVHFGLGLNYAIGALSAGVLMDSTFWSGYRDANNFKQRTFNLIVWLDKESNQLTFSSLNDDVRKYLTREEAQAYENELDQINLAAQEATIEPDSKKATEIFKSFISDDAFKAADKIVTIQLISGAK